uniref:Uncharacterized protein n=1 Tax=Rhizophora mucronata TaxID=61149 RepID=A0A2P2JBK0_RHIMU
MAVQCQTLSATGRLCCTLSIAFYTASFSQTGCVCSETSTYSIFATTVFASSISHCRCEEPEL